jgi:invasion protein IalB
MEFVMISIARKILPAIAATLALGTGYGALPAAAQDAPAAGQPPLGWFKTCNKQEDNDICLVQNIVRANNGQMLTAVALISVEGKVNRKLLQVSVPSARLIQPGVQMQIDGGQGQQVPYAVCLPDRCTAEVPLTDAMIASLKKGGEVVFTSINFRRAPNPIKVSLGGFTAAYDGEPMSESKLAETQRSLEESMQKKAEEARKKLEDAQNAAKQSENN